MVLQIWDYILIAWIAFIALYGYCNGFLKSISNILKLSIIILIFLYGSVWIQKAVQQFIEDELAVLIISIIIILLVSILLVAWISSIIEQAIHNYTTFRYLNKLLGLVLGATKGIAIIILLLVVLIKLNFKLETLDNTKYLKQIKHWTEQLMQDEVKITNSILPNNTSLKWSG